MSEMRKLTPTEIIRMMGWTLTETANILGCSHMTVQRKKKSGKWTATDIKILSEKSEIPYDKIAF